MKCKTCGTALMDGDKFCPVCGAKTEADQLDSEAVQEQSVETVANEEVNVEETVEPTVETVSEPEESILEKNSKMIYESAETTELEEKAAANFDFKHNIIAVVGAIVAIIGCFLPFAKVGASFMGYSQSTSVSYVGSGGIILIVAIVVGAVLTCMQKDKTAIGPTAIAAIILIYEVINVNNVMSDSSISYLSSYVDVSLGMGVYVIAAGIIAMGVGIFLQLNKKNAE